MTLDAVLLPVFVYVLMVFGLLGGLIVSRAVARQPGADTSRQQGWDRRAALVGASYANQFELPVLFLALVACGLASGRTDGAFVVLEWLFVVSRLLHAGVHVTSNIIPLRGAAFAAGAALLGFAWLRFALEVFTAA